MKLCTAATSAAISAISAMAEAETKFTGVAGDLEASEETRAETERSSKVDNGESKVDEAKPE